MDLKSCSLSGNWILVKEEDHIGKALSDNIPTEELYHIQIPHQYEQEKWKYDYAYSRAVSRYHGYVWFYRSFWAPDRANNGDRLLLEFDRVSYLCQVYLNGAYVGEHRHSEESFSFDITDLVDYGKENLLAVRCFEPVCGCEAIDGIRLDLIPNGFWAGSETSPNLFPIDSAGGILEDVRISFVPKTRIDDVFILPDPKTGRVDAEIALINSDSSEENIALDIRFADAKTGGTVACAKGELVAKVGENKITLTAYIPEWKLWEINCPALYTMEVRASNGGAYSLRFGFKDISVKDGFFFVNGKRTLLKCAHGTPSAETVIEMKAMGFNAFRSIQHVMPKEVLDLCDELGFMIIEAPLTSWGMRLHGNTGAMIESALCNMVKKHRNHVCIFGFYLFNELENRDILHLGSKCLPLLRALAPNALFLLSSGRWDYEYDLGSVSLPYSDKWDCVFGNEGNADTVEHTYPSRFLALNNLGMGDLHPYPYLPMDSAAKKWFRTVGTENNSRPVLISESGIGTQEHTQRCLFERLRLGMPSDGESVKEITATHLDFERFLVHYGMDGVFPFASELCRMSDRENGRQRQMLFDLIRSNPMINGYSLTSWGCGNEGTLEGLGVIKEGLAYAIQEGLAPLRWALFTSERVVYENAPFKIEAVLCNEDFLAPGSYRAEARIKGCDGIVWKKDFVAVYPSVGYGNMPPLAAVVLSEEIQLPEGDYTLAVRLLEGGCPYGGTLRFSVVSPKSADINKKSPITVWGLSKGTLEVLKADGISVKEYSPSVKCGTLFVGSPVEINEENVKDLTALIEEGTSVVFLNPELFHNAAASALLRKISGDGAKCSHATDWLYHFDTVHIRHPLFDGIHDEGLLELDAFFELYPRTVFVNTEKADVTVAASVRVDAGACATSLAIGEFALGKGRAVINGFRIEEAIGKNPYAERMLFNFISYYGR